MKIILVGFGTFGILVGFGTFGIWPVSRNALSDEDFKEASAVCVGVRNPLIRVECMFLSNKTHFI